MRNKAFWKKRMITLAVTAALSVAAVTSGPAVTAWATPASGTAVVDNVVVRESAVSGSQIGGLSEGQAVTIVGETTGSDGKTWYQITYTVDGTEHSGWVRGDLLNTSDESLETNTADTDTDTSDADASGSDTDAGAADTDPEEGESVSLEFETKSGYIILTDVPEEERMLVSDRFVETSLDFAEGTIAAFQLAEPDALVADDAAIVDYYYVYGYNEVGETGWYVYNAEDGTIQKNLLNMQYSIAETAEEETEDSGTEFSVDSLTRMAFSTLGVICLLLLVITIIFSVRYRRLRRILEEEIAEDEQPAAREPDVKRGRQSNAKGSARHPSEEKAYMKIDQGADQQETGEKRSDAASSGTGKRTSGADQSGTGKGKPGADQSGTGKGKPGANQQETGKRKRRADQQEAGQKKPAADSPDPSAKGRQQPSEQLSEIGGVDVMDLDFMDDTDFEALLNRYLEEDLAAAGGEAIQAGEAPVEPAPAQETVRARKIPAEPAPAQEIVQARKVSAEQTSAQETVRAREKSAAAGAPDEDDYDIPVEQGADYDIPASEDEDIVDLGALNMPDDEPEFYDDDDDDDDLEFL